MFFFLILYIKERTSLLSTWCLISCEGTPGGSETFLWLQLQHFLTLKEATSLEMISLNTAFMMLMIKSTWWERRWSRPRWWWRIQWGVPWCLQSGSTGPPAWSSCLSRCRQRSLCQSRSAPHELWNYVAPSLKTTMFMQLLEMTHISHSHILQKLTFTYQTCLRVLQNWIQNV